MDNSIWNSQRFTNVLVSWFNALPENERVVSGAKFFRVVLVDGVPSVAHSGDVTALESVDTANIKASAVYSWVGATGTNLTSSASDFFELSATLPALPAVLHTGQPAGNTLYTVNIEIREFGYEESYPETSFITVATSDTNPFTLTCHATERNFVSASFLYPAGLSFALNCENHLSIPATVTVLADGTPCFKSDFPALDMPIFVQNGVVTPNDHLFPYDTIAFDHDISKKHAEDPDQTNAYLAILKDPQGNYFIPPFRGAFGASIPTTPKAAITSKDGRLFVAVKETRPYEESPDDETALFRYDGPNYGFRKKASIPNNDISEITAALKHTMLTKSPDDNYLVAYNGDEYDQYSDEHLTLGTVYDISSWQYTSVRVDRPAEGWHFGNTDGIGQGEGGQLSNLFFGPAGLFAVWSNQTPGANGTTTTSAILLQFSPTTGQLVARRNLTLPPNVLLDFTRVDVGDSFLVVADAVPNGPVNNEYCTTTLYSFAVSSGAWTSSKAINYLDTAAYLNIESGIGSTVLPVTAVKEVCFGALRSGGYRDIFCLMYSGEIVRYRMSAGGTISFDTVIGLGNEADVISHRMRGFDNVDTSILGGFTYVKPPAQDTAWMGGIVSTDHVMQKATQHFVAVSAGNSLSIPFYLSQFNGNNYRYQTSRRRHFIATSVSPISIAQQTINISELEA